MIISSTEGSGEFIELDDNINYIYEHDNEVFDKYFINYLNYSTKIDKETTDQMIEMIPARDEELLDHLLDKSPKIEGHSKSYKKKVNKTGVDIVNSLMNNLGYKPRNLKSYLDIGAIRTGHLEYVSKSLRIPYDKVYGINIEDDSKGSLKYGVEQNKSKIITYDGSNIPEINGIKEYDLITVISTLHHIPPDVLRPLAQSISDHCSKYLLIKENDLDDRKSKTYFTWQHLVWWRSKEMKSYTRHDLDAETLINMFTELGFEYVGYSGLDTFLKSKWHLFKKK